MDWEFRLSQGKFKGVCWKLNMQAWNVWKYSEMDTELGSLG
jgi:hypothetical protein